MSFIMINAPNTIETHYLENGFKVQMSFTFGVNTALSASHWSWPIKPKTIQENNYSLQLINQCISTFVSLPPHFSHSYNGGCEQEYVQMWLILLSFHQSCKTNSAADATKQV